MHSAIAVHIWVLHLEPVALWATRWLAPLVGWLISLSNRYILSQYYAVVITQTPAGSSDARGDQLIGADRAIVQFRRLHARLLERSDAPTVESTP
jgi:hypothetical protein